VTTSCVSALCCLIAARRPPAVEWGMIHGAVVLVMWLPGLQLLGQQQRACVGDDRVICYTLTTISGEHEQ
jgi:hypothetical protein